mgnify:CR=1 FL=1
MCAPFATTCSFRSRHARRPYGVTLAGNAPWWRKAKPLTLNPSLPLRIHAARLPGALRLSRRCGSIQQPGTNIDRRRPVSRELGQMVGQLVGPRRSQTPRASHNWPIKVGYLLSCPSRGRLS